MKKYKFGILICSITLILGITINNYEYEFNSDEIFNLAKEYSNVIKSYEIKDEFTLYLNDDNFSKKEKSENLINEFFNSIKINNSNTKTNEEKLKEPLEKYKMEREFEVLLQDGIPYEYIFLNKYKGKENYEEYIYLKNGKINILDNGNFKIEDIDEDYFNTVNYNKILKGLSENSSGVNFEKMDNFYIFKEEDNDIQSEYAKKIYELFELKEYIDNSNIIKYEDIINTKWDEEYFFIAYSISENYSKITKVHLTINAIKGDKNYIIDLNKELNKFNLIDEINIPEKLKGKMVGGNE